DFTKTVMEAIQLNLDNIRAIEKKKEAISIKATDTEQELKTLEQNCERFSRADDILNDTLEAHETRMEKLAGIDSRKQVLESFMGKMTEADTKCDRHLKYAQEEMCKVFRGAVHSYVIKARLNIAEVIDEILNEDKKCFDTVFSLYNQIYQKTGINEPQIGFDFRAFTYALYPLVGQKAGMKEMVSNIKMAVGQFNTESS
ncbi:MAG: hypothetical protein GXP11_02015, partial [Gammaproteobacteria bacterium]|nr:hypothetical protein [Gammaproteobacteria bacterium]